MKASSTTSQPSRSAGANIAAAHYHFGDKEQLYRAVFEHADRCAGERFAGEIAPVDAPAEARLRALIESFLSRHLDEGQPAWFGKLIAREMVEPTPALDALVQDKIRGPEDKVVLVEFWTYGCRIAARQLRVHRLPDAARRGVRRRAWTHSS